MSTPTLAFRDAGTTLNPDTCEPLRRASRQRKIVLAAAGRGNYPGWTLPDAWASEIRSVGVWDAARPQDWGLDWHRNEGIEITYLESGKLWFEVDGCPRGIWLQGGDLTITRPWQLHRLGNPEISPSRLHWVILDVGVRRPNQSWHWPAWLLYAKPQLDQLTLALRHNEQPVWRTNGDVRRAWQKLSDHLRRRRRDRHDVWFKLHINEIVVALGEMLLQREVILDSTLSSTQRTVELFLSDLARRLAEPWTIQHMADECGLNRTRFAHYCKQITNMTPTEYLTVCRVDAATRMLSDPAGAPITQIALDCGFGSSQYFATVFRRQTGLTPREFRAQHTDAATPDAHDD
jgi:AraC family L-rhamnose operon regulatory protein RhaS